MSNYKRRRGNVHVLRMAIEKGQQLDPATIEKLTSHHRRESRVDPMDLKLGGIIRVAKAATRE